MALLTVVAPLNNDTIYFRHRLPKPNYIRLISCSLYNSWYNLKDKGEISVRLKDSSIRPIIVEFKPGFYTPKSMAQSLSSKFTAQFINISIGTDSALGAMVIFSPKSQYLIGLTWNLSLLFDTNSKIFPHIAVNKIHITEHIFCSL